MNFIIFVFLSAALAVSLAFNRAQEQTILDLRSELYDAQERMSPVGCAEPGLWEDAEDA